MPDDAPQPYVRRHASFRDLRPEQQQRKRQVLTRRSPSKSRDIADAVVVKNEDLFFLTQPDGNVPLTPGHGLGLYYHDCRYLNGYALSIDGNSLEGLAANETQGFTATFELTNPDLHIDGKPVQRERIGVHWRRVLVSRYRVLRDRLRFQNYSEERLDLPLWLRFSAGFEDIFKVRGLLDEQPGTLHAPSWDEHGSLHFTYDGCDGITRRLVITFSPAPARRDETRAFYRVELPARESFTLHVSLVVEETPHADVHSHSPAPVVPLDLDRLVHEMRAGADRRMPGYTELHSDSVLLQAVIDRSLRDLHVLQSDLEHLRFFSAGVPWFATLFGRDSIIAAMQVLPHAPAIAAETLRLHARYQGDREDPWRDEQPGKILHELRDGELARIGAIPYTPYYGTVDATPLFLILLGRYCQWTGDLGLFHELRANVERALAWIRDYGDNDGDGYVDYESDTDGGMVNQGWKDSGDAIVNSDGSLATPPIALVEVQGYVYRAWREMARLFRQAGEAERADALERNASDLRTRFNRDYWLADCGHYALALQRGKQPASVVSSNPGQALWAGIADPGKARRTADMLMAEDMFSGWGVRTLSNRAQRFNPIGYHLGTVWPHDNALIAAGLRRYGHDDAALKIAAGIIEAAMGFKGYRLPEVFSGYPRGDYLAPVRYPVANHPQAWAAGAVPFIMESLLGLRPQAFAHRLRIVRPVLPHFVNMVELRGLRVGQSSADIRFERRDGSVMIDVLRAEYPLDVVVES